MRRRALAVRTDPAHLGQVEVTSLHSGGERRPLLRSEGQPRPVRVLGIAHRDGAGQVPRYFHARTAVAAAVAALAPLGASYAVHRSSATFPIRSREAPRGRASALSRSNAKAALLASADFSIVWPSTAVSAYKILGAPSKPATMNAPSKPVCAPTSAGTT